jgi:hypothetical protein
LSVPGNTDCSTNLTCFQKGPSDECDSGCCFFDLGDTGIAVWQDRGFEFAAKIVDDLNFAAKTE